MCATRRSRTWRQTSLASSAWPTRAGLHERPIYTKEENVNDETPMTKAERAELAKVVRMNERVAKAAAAQRAAELLADFEAQVATDYHLNDEVVWQEAYASAKAA